MRWVPWPSEDSTWYVWTGPQFRHMCDNDTATRRCDTSDKLAMVRHKGEQIVGMVFKIDADGPQNVMVMSM